MFSSHFLQVYGIELHSNDRTVPYKPPDYKMRVQIMNANKAPWPRHNESLKFRL